MTLFWVVWIAVIVQRLVELIYAKRNERWMRARGAVEHGRSHYKWIVLVHGGFFAALLLEWLTGAGALHPFWPVFLALFIVVQGMRIWVLQSLGRFWNTKILVIPGEKRVEKGAYGKIRHPNYIIVTLELIIMPLIFQAYITLLVFTLLNAFILLYIRIPAEEKALGITGGSDPVNTD
ncbi:hypothetical protein K8O68_09175 [Salipaludibacillus sp. CUR1]|uniref:isoprenylcysteine carboxyl methyltransferase family protein n=1 Tax=Salipaludibacillus sp. CUR1 TaxID=2820003 RepID=UPI001E41B96B|nr:isoprenylcysteine carboxylmethyltransferase family protein [Salipaludibacillus sp. CUR1]MCE7792588.1 hypothetical protein [Salipaludibacillus sp. CUR1]